ncbi:MAG: hypothetical protein N2381_08330, partial [Armatimonadetes bacterium]|nr:hypothetical protein [Armatimonadota bacterium]
GEATDEPKNPMRQFVVRHETKWSAVKNAVTLPLHGVEKFGGSGYCPTGKLDEKIGKPVGLSSK